jgi:cyclopropane-fatty-acyl-phospholipid synthase
MLTLPPFMGQTLTSSVHLPVRCGKPALREGMERLLARADIRIDGRRPWDMQVHRPGVLERLAVRGSLGLGET